MAIIPSSAWAQRTWTGTDSNAWNVANNWGGILPTNLLVFGSGTGSGGLNLNNNLTTGAGWNVSGITFNAGAPAFVLGDGTLTANTGNTFTLSSGGITNNSTSLQTVNLPFAVSGARGITTSAGGGDISLRGNISGPGGLNLLGSGITLLSGSNSYLGNTSLGAGTYVLGHNSVFSTGTVTVAASTLQASSDLPGVTASLYLGSGASLTVSGTNSIAFANSVTAQGSQRQITNNLPSGKTLTISGTMFTSIPTEVARGFLIGGSGRTIVTGNIVNSGSSGNAPMTFNGSGVVVLSGSNSYLGATTINGGGIVRLDSAQALPGGIGSSGGLSNLLVSNGIVGLAAGDFTRGTGTGPSQVNLSGTSGFAAYGGNRTVNLGGASGTVAWTAGQFVSGNMLLSAVDADGTIDFQNPIALNNAIRTFVVADGSAAIDAKLSGIVSGTGTSGLTKTGAGVLQMSAVNTYSGTTTVSAGRFLIDGSGNLTNTARVVVNGPTAELRWNSASSLSRPLDVQQGTISGTGTINTPVSVGANATLSPGNSPGTQTYLSGTWASGGTYQWEVNDWTSGTAGTNFDQAIFTNGLAITSSSASPFTISLVSLKSDNTPGAVPGFNSGLTGLSFVIASGTMTGYSPAVFTLGTSNFLSANTVSGSANGGFWLSSNSGSSQLILNYAPSARYTLSATPAATAIRVGSSTIITGSITNSTADRTGADSLSFSGLSVGSGSLSTTSGTLASGNSSSGTVTYTGTAAGSFAFTPTVSASNVNLGSAALAGTVTSGTVNVYNPAVATTSGSVNIGTVIVGAPSLSQALSITNSAPTGGFSESLNASFGTFSGVTTNSGSFSLLPAGSTNSSSMTVSFATGSVGYQTGSAELLFATDGQGTSGLATAALAPQTVNVYGTVLDHATPGFLGVLNPLTTSTLSLDFGSVDESTGMQTRTFSLTNLAALVGADLTAGLALTGTDAGSGPFSLSGAGFSNLLAGGTSGLFTVSFTPTGQGSFSQQFTLSFSDNTSLAGATARRDLFVAANVIVVPEPATLATAITGIVICGYAVSRRRRIRPFDAGKA